MFIGEFSHNIDEKGRLAIPTKFKEKLKGGGVVTRGLDGCLFVYPLVEWNKLAEKLSSLPISQSNSRAFARLMLAGAMPVKPDKQGRIHVPDYLREFGKLKKKVVVAGLFNRIEIWDSQAWDRYKSVTEKDSNAISEKMGELGI